MTLTKSGSVAQIGFSSKSRQHQLLSLLPFAKAFLPVDSRLNDSEDKGSVRSPRVY